MTTPDPITTAREAALELRQIACLLNDDQAQTGANFDREADITAALDHADGLTREVRDLQDLAKIRNDQHAAENEKLKAERDEALTQIGLLGVQIETIRGLKATEALNEITRLTSQLEQAEKVIAPFVTALKTIPHEGLPDDWRVWQTLELLHLRAASQWIKDCQAKTDASPVQPDPITARQVIEFMERETGLPFGDFIGEADCARIKAMALSIGDK